VEIEKWLSDSEEEEVEYSDGWKPPKNQEEMDELDRNRRLEYEKEFSTNSDISRINDNIATLQIATAEQPKQRETLVRCIISLLKLNRMRKGLYQTDICMDCHSKRKRLAYPVVLVAIAIMNYRLHYQICIE